MTLEIKTAAIEPVRQTYAHIARRFGDKPATRYQEATYDAQATANFHYRPLWMPDKTLNDASHTAIVMADWYALKDPRQFYYGAYVQNRARMQESAEHSYSFFAKRQCADYLSAEVKQRITVGLLPLRHVEQTANLNHMSGAAYGYGTAVTQACLYAGMDRLGMAQYLSRIGLMLDDNSGTSLTAAKNEWMNNPAWQGLRALCEEMLVCRDWFELMLVQTVLMDSHIQQLAYHAFGTWLDAHQGRDVAMLTEFMQDCLKDVDNWADSVIKLAAAESEANRELLRQWAAAWQPKVAAAWQALAPALLDEDAEAAMAAAADTVNKRLAKLGLAT
ncbi:MAG: aromatic/alkene monooxygenase hydroxylase subunit beta [Eikenella sp.]|nr:aromatic/alkene monooxygenase hydroxylase subunit beta [Eikenella sp.]